MNLSKIDTALCFAFQEHDGPFFISIEVEKENIIFTQMFKEEIKNLSSNENIIFIKMVNKPHERRWIDRWSEDRRKNR